MQRMYHTRALTQTGHHQPAKGVFVQSSAQKGCFLKVSCPLVKEQLVDCLSAWTGPIYMWGFLSGSMHANPPGVQAPTIWERLSYRSAHAHAARDR